MHLVSYFLLLIRQVYRKAKSRIHEYAWIIFGWYPENVWEESFVNRSSNLSYNGSAYNDCTSEELKEMFNRAIIMTRYPRFNRRETEHIVGDIVSILDCFFVTVYGLADL